MPAIFRAAAEANHFVLNGDIFDFRWSRYVNVPETVRHAIEWVDKLVASNPACKFHYVLGNHDSVHEFIEALGQYSAERPNFAWHPYYVKLGSAVFLHGEVAHRRMTAADLTRLRTRCLYDKRRGEVLNRVWDAAFGAGVHKAICHAVSPTRVVVERVHHYLDSVGEGHGSGTREVYFGHTHVPVRGYEHRGIRYHNGGAPMRGLQFDVLQARIAI